MTVTNPQAVVSNARHNRGLSPILFPGEMWPGNEICVQQRGPHQLPCQNAAGLGVVAGVCGSHLLKPAGRVRWYVHLPIALVVWERRGEERRGEERRGEERGRRCVRVHTGIRNQFYFVFVTHGRQLSFRAVQLGLCNVGIDVVCAVMKSGRGTRCQFQSRAVRFVQLVGLSHVRIDHCLCSYGM